MLQLYKDGSKRIFVLVDKNNLNEKVHFAFPTRYYKDQYNIMAAIYAYLYRYHGASFI